MMWENSSKESVVDAIKKASENIMAQEYKNKVQKFFIPPKASHEALQKGWIVYDTENNCHRITDEGMRYFWLIGVKQDCEIYISHNL